MIIVIPSEVLHIKIEGKDCGRVRRFYFFFMAAMNSSVGIAGMLMI